MKRVRADLKDTVSDREAQEGQGQEEEEEEEEEEKEERKKKKKKKREEDQDEVDVGLGLECVSDDALMLIMDWCGLKRSVRAFFLANRRLHALVCGHQALWRRAYLQLFQDEDDEDDDDEYMMLMMERKMKMKKEDYFTAYVRTMRKWSGAFSFYEPGVPLAESDGRLVVKVDFLSGRATWEGYGIGCGRAGAHTVLKCLAGRGRLVVEEDKKGEQVAFVVGHEDDKKDTCARLPRYDPDYDGEEKEDDDDSDDDEDDDEQERAKTRKRREEEKARRERKRKKRAELRAYPRRWIESKLAEMRQSRFFFEPVRYQLHASLPDEARSGSSQKRKWCTGGGMCRYWQYDMEW